MVGEELLAKADVISLWYPPSCDSIFLITLDSVDWTSESLVSTDSSLTSTQIWPL